MENSNYSLDNSESTLVNYQNTEEDNPSFSLSMLLKDSGRHAIKSAKWFIAVIVILGFINTIFILINIFSFNQSVNYKLIISLCISAGILLTITGVYLTYRYILMDTFKIAYKYLTPFFKKLSLKIVDSSLSAGDRITGFNIEKSINTLSLTTEVYGQRLPKLVRKGVSIVLKKIPFSDFLSSMQKELNEKSDDVTLSLLLYNKVDDYIHYTLFNSNNMKWLVWLCLANITLQLAIIYFLK